MHFQAARLRIVLAFPLAACLLILMASVALADSEPAAWAARVTGPTTPATVLAAGPSCRYGVAALGPAQYTWVGSLAAGWYLNFGPRDGGAAPAEFAPVIRIKQNKQGCTYLPGYTVTPPLTSAGLGAAVLNYPGALWIVGNEPDRGPNPESCTVGVQDDVQPDVYAQAYHDVYQFIKRADRSARVANAGLVEVTPGRLQYLDKVWTAYQQKYGQPWPVDVWNMHLYILPEVDAAGKPNGIANTAVGTDPALGIRESGGDKRRCDDPNTPANEDDPASYCWAEHDDMRAFAQQVVAMRTWMKAHGQQEKALILSEYSLLYPYIIDAPGQCFLADEFGNCFTPTRVRDFMNRSLDYLETAFDTGLGYSRDGYHLVQRWLWFSVLTNGAGSASNLADDALQSPTLPGQNFQLRAAAAPRTLNLYPAATSAAARGVPGASEPLTATLTASVVNSGSAATNGSVTVTFYADAALTQPIASTNFVEPLNGCEINTVRVAASWPGQVAGRREYWVVVDSDKVWAETNEADNVLKGVLFVGSRWTYLPIILR